VDELTHLDQGGRVKMVNVGDKPITHRRATAEAVLIAGEDVMRAVAAGATPKGNVYECARIAGILAAKRTPELIPLCHNLPLDEVAIDFEPAADRIRVVAHATTGVEMEALTAAATAALTLYDMLKALSRAMEITSVRLLEKSGGQHGDYVAAPRDAAGGEKR
jgi:cyclic pyranopterin phosphate synthase